MMIPKISGLELKKGAGVYAEFKKNAKVYAAVLFFALALLLFLSVLRNSLFGDIDEEKKIWFELSFLLLAAIMAEMLVNYLKQPVVMVLLIVGVVISPSASGIIYGIVAGVLDFLLAAAGIVFFMPADAPHLVQSGGLIEIFAKLGAILLLFKIGLHCETKKIFNVKNLVIALLGVVVPFAGGYYFAVAGGHSFYYALFLGAALTATSVGVTVAVLEELKLLQTQMAQALLGAAVIDDILALLVLSFVQNIPAGGIGEGVFLQIGSLVATTLIFVVGGILLGRFVVTVYFDPIVGTEKMPKRGFLAMLMYLLFYAYVAEFIGLSAIVGAFIAGITMNYSHKTERLLDMFYPLEALFTPVFFISLGLLVDVNALVENIVPIFIVTLLAIATKIVGCGVGAVLSGSNVKEGIAIGAGMVPRGEIALIIGLYGLTALTPEGVPVLGPSEYAVIASMAFITTIIAPPLIQMTAGKNAAAVQ
ncbi:cation:proton antiporter [Candidatus Micrarchaeota archaeon]|nr:cation:proton antiporter [Candidatus Micrarchaeota archaeon]